MESLGWTIETQFLKIFKISQGLDGLNNQIHQVGFTTLHGLASYLYMFFFDIGYATKMYIDKYLQGWFHKLQPISFRSGHHICLEIVFSMSQVPMGIQWLWVRPSCHKLMEKSRRNRKKIWRPKLFSRWWFQTCFFFHPYLRKWSNTTNIFQMGWLHCFCVDYTPGSTNIAGWKMDLDWRCISYWTWGYSIVHQRVTVIVFGQASLKVNTYPKTNIPPEK